MTQEPITDVLGEPWVAETLTLPDDVEGEVVATLVSRRTQEPTRRAVLHVHGFADYFFHTEYAAWWVERGYDFYALDLRKYGRSLLPHQTPNFCTDVAEYDAELAEAWSRITERDGHTDVVVVAHSTGGLITSLWLDERRRAGYPPPKAMVLNSPWLDLQGSVFVRTVGTQAIDRIGARRPYQMIPHKVAGVYAESIHAEHRGEWEFDVAWKPIESFPVRAGWLRAIRRAHRRLHRGVDSGAPVLVLASRRTAFTTVWTEDVSAADIVLDVEQIARWSHRLGPYVTVARVDGALHDVFLSAEPVRTEAYGLTERWLAAHS